MNYHIVNEYNCKIVFSSNDPKAMGSIFNYYKLPIINLIFKVTEHWLNVSKMENAHLEIEDHDGSPQNIKDL